MKMIANMTRPPRLVTSFTNVLSTMRPIAHYPLATDVSGIKIIATTSATCTMVIPLPVHFILTIIANTILHLRNAKKSTTAMEPIQTIALRFNAFFIVIGQTVPAIAITIVRCTMGTLSLAKCEHLAMISVSAVTIRAQRNAQLSTIA
jgi:hypothetical protein